MKGGKWDNCNSIINKIYLKNKIKILAAHQCAVELRLEIAAVSEISQSQKDK